MDSDLFVFCFFAGLYGQCRHSALCDKALSRIDSATLSFDLAEVSDTIDELAPVPGAQ
eukprot:COSAG05_NODE_3086_length_2335_cov_258.283989_5_plen_58_part_00